MGTVAVEQRNNEYILRPLSWFGRGRTRTQSKICGYIARYARNGKSYTVKYNVNRLIRLGFLDIEDEKLSLV